MNRRLSLTAAALVAIALATPVAAENETMPAKKPAKGEAQPKAASKKKEAAAATGPVESKDILAREPVTEKAKVKHVLVGWKELAPAYGGGMAEKAKTRTKDEADKLAREILKKATAGADFDAMMKEFSEDPGSAATGMAYDVTPSAGLVPPFKNLSLRLKPNETGVVETTYGWHIIKRVE